MVPEAEPDRVEIFWTTMEWPWAEKPLPPNCLGMIMPKKPCSLHRLQNSSVKSLFSVME